MAPALMHIPDGFQNFRRCAALEQVTAGAGFQALKTCSLSHKPYRSGLEFRSNCFTGRCIQCRKYPATEVHDYDLGSVLGIRLNAVSPLDRCKGIEIRVSRYDSGEHAQDFFVVLNHGDFDGHKIG